MENYVHRIEESCRFCQPPHTASYERNSGIPLPKGNQDMPQSSPVSEEPLLGSFNAQNAAKSAQNTAEGIILPIITTVRCRGPPPHLDFSTKFR